MLRACKLGLDSFGALCAARCHLLAGEQVVTVRELAARPLGVLARLAAGRGDLGAAEASFEEATKLARENTAFGLELRGLWQLKTHVLEPLGRQAPGESAREHKHRPA